MSKTAQLLHELVRHSADRYPDAVALACEAHSLDYATLQEHIARFAGGLIQLGLAKGDRIAIYLEKRFEAVIASFGASAAGCIFVPINPILKAEQVAHILRDCDVRLLVTSTERLALLESVLPGCHNLAQVVPVASPAWQALMEAAASERRGATTDSCALFYTSGSTGKPKGVILSHRNLVVGAASVASYLDNVTDDRLLAVLPLSFDAGFSQLTTAFHAGARVVLLNYLLPRDVLNALAAERITGLTAVPPLYIQLAKTTWPENLDLPLRYFASTGGRMPRETLNILRQRLPKAKPFLMYGLTEAFRSTYLPPDQVDRRPDSIGKGIPNVEILVLRTDGTPCMPNEPGELVHRGPLVAQGYWNDPERTAERFKPLPNSDEIAVFSGDTVRRDEEGFLYFIGRRDEMIKTSGYRVSPTEVEEIVYSIGIVGECAAIGVDDPILGQSIRLIVTPGPNGEPDTTHLLAECRKRMPAYMVPTAIEIRPAPLPRNPNGKIDRQALYQALPPDPIRATTP